GMLAFLQGRWDDAFDLIERAREAWDRIGNHWAAAYAMGNNGELRSDQGRYDEGEALLRGALRIIRASQSPSQIADIGKLLGRLLARTGQLDEAKALLTEARDAYEHDGNKAELLATEAKFAECLIFQGETEAAFGLASALLNRAPSVSGS